LNFSSLLKPAVALAVVASFSVGANAQSLRKMTDRLDLNPQQRQQVQQILRSGDKQDPATRQRMQSQILSVLNPQQQQQLVYLLQSRQGQRSANNYAPYYPSTQYPYAANGYTTNYPYANNGYSAQYPYSQPYVNGAYTQPYVNNGYYNNGYNTGAYYPNNGYYPNSGLNTGLNVLGGLLNSGILNGMFQNLIR
jgi:hypothetical protein